MAHRDTQATFPVPSETVLLEKLKAVVTSPVTWITLIAAMTAVALKPNLWGVLMAAGALLGGGFYWKKRLPHIEERIMKSLIESSNETQNRSLKDGIEQLRDWDYDNDADKLAELLALKKQVEETIHSQAPRSSMDESIETLVDTLCNEVSRDLFKIADIRYTLRKKRKRLSHQQKQDMETDQKELSERVEQATIALRETHQQLILTTGRKIPDEGDNPLLDQTIERLREEAALAARIRARIDSSFGSELEHPVVMESGSLNDPIIDSGQTTYSSSRSDQNSA